MQEVVGAIEKKSGRGRTENGENIIHIYKMLKNKV